MGNRAGTQRRRVFRPVHLQQHRLGQSWETSYRLGRGVGGTVKGRQVDGESKRRLGPDPRVKPQDVGLSVAMTPAVQPMLHTYGGTTP